MTTELIERLRQHADTFEKSGFAVDGLIKDYREAADTIQLLSEKLHASQTEPCEDCISRHVVKEQMIKYGFHAPDMTVTEFVEDLPQKEITIEDVKDYCESRNLVVISKDLFVRMNRTADEIYTYLKDRERR